MTAPADIDDDGMESPVVLVHCDGCGASDRTTNPAAWQASHEQCIGGRLFEGAA